MEREPIHKTSQQEWSLRDYTVDNRLTCRIYHPTFCSMATNLQLSTKRADELRRLLQKRLKKAKASVTLSGELIEATDVIAGKAQRSAFVERAIRRYLRTLLRQVRHQHDLEAINAKATISNRASDDLLDLQAWPE